MTSTYPLLSYYTTIIYSSPNPSSSNTQTPIHQVIRQQLSSLANGAIFNTRNQPGKIRADTSEPASANPPSAVQTRPIELAIADFSRTRASTNTSAKAGNASPRTRARAPNISRERATNRAR